MANNRIQIKRSTANATVTGLQPGELAFTANGNIFYIGNPADGASVRIAGLQVPGTLTANQALVANTTSGIDKVIVANLVPTSIWANGASGSAGDVLHTNSTAVYWRAPSAGVAGSDTQVQFNDGGNLGGDPGFTYSKTTDTVTANGGFQTINTGTGTGGFLSNTTTVVVGNTSVNTAITSAGLTVNGTAVVANSTGVWTTGTVNAASHTVGSVFVANTITLNANGVVVNSTGGYFTGLVNSTSFNAGAIGTGTGGSVQNTTTMFVGNNTINTVITSAGLTVNGTAAIANSSGFYTTGTVNAASHTAGAIGTGTGGSVQNTTTIFVGNNTINTSISAGAITVNGTAVIANNTGVYTTGVVNAATLSVGTSVTANTTRLVIGTGVALQANGGIGAAGEVLHSNGSTIYWAVDDQGVTSVATGNGMTGGTITTTGTVSVLANNGIVANSTGTFVAGANGISVTAAGVNVLAGTNGGLVSNSTGVFVTAANGLFTDSTGLNVGAGNGISVSADAVAVNGGSTLTVNTLGVHVNSTLTITDLTLSGNLTVLGDLVSMNVATLAVEDSLITLAKDQGNTGTYTDNLDIGFVGTYGNTANLFYSGLFRDQSDSIWKLFASNGTVTNTVVDTATSGFKLATLQTYLASSGLVTNATHVAVTANSTVNVTITANTLTLSTPLAGTSGGTGKSTMTSQAILVGNTTNGYNELTLNTNPGYVLQSNGTALIYDWLDGGTF